MTDERTPDERDDELASLLEVPALDEDTRRRLVSRAVDEAGPARVPPLRSRVLVPVAAALVALLLVGIGVFVFVGRDDGGTERAGRAPTPKSATPGGSSTRPDASSGGEADGVRDLGDLGDVSDTATLRREVGERLGRPPASARAAAPSCLARAETGSPPPTAYGTGTHGGRPVLVLVLPASGDHSTVVLLATQTCRAVSVSDLR
jgi:hypothetical protein